MTLTLALGTVLPAIGAGAIAVVAFGMGWMAGVWPAIATAFENESLGHGRGGESLALPERRPVARRGLRARAAAGRGHRGRRRANGASRANPFFAIDAAADARSSSGRRSGSSSSWVSPHGGCRGASSDPANHGSGHWLRVEQGAPQHRVPGGRAALKIERKTSAETVFFPFDPMSVTLISRPETPRSRRSRAVSVPTFVRVSAANHADSCGRGVGPRRPRRIRARPRRTPCRPPADPASRGGSSRRRRPASRSPTRRRSRCARSPRRRSSGTARWRSSTRSTAPCRRSSAIAASVAGRSPCAPR